MSLSRVMGYYCVLLLLCSMVFAGWTPPSADVPPSATAEMTRSVTEPAAVCLARQTRPRLLPLGKDWRVS